MNPIVHVDEVILLVDVDVTLIQTSHHSQLVLVILLSHFLDDIHTRYSKSTGTPKSRRLVKRAEQLIDRKRAENLPHRYYIISRSHKVKTRILTFIQMNCDPASQGLSHYWIGPSWSFQGVVHQV